MDIRKLQDAVTELEVEASRCLHLASDLKAAIKRSQNGHADVAESGQKGTPLRLALKSKKGSDSTVIAVAVKVLKEAGKPIHVTELVPVVSEIRGEKATRASIESALVRGMNSEKWKRIIRRTAPSTFSVQE